MGKIETEMTWENMKMIIFKKKQQQPTQCYLTPGANVRRTCGAPETLEPTACVGPAGGAWERGGVGTTEAVLEFLTNSQLWSATERGQLSETAQKIPDKFGRIRTAENFGRKLDPDIL